jgi:hypothetical protein
MKDTLQDIHNTAHNLDIFGEASELEAAQFVDEMSGDVDDTHPEDANVPDSMPLPAALTLVETSREDGFRFMQEIAEQMLARFSAKSEDLKSTQDARTLNHQMAMGVKALLVEWGARIAEAESRVAASTPDERRLLGVNVAEILEPSEPEVESRSTSSVTGPPSASVMQNTKRAQEFLAKSDASRD